MKKLIKVTTITLAAIVVTLLVLGFAISRYINTDSVKNEISHKVYESTGRQLTINGPLKWSFFPWLGVSITDASLSNPKGFPTTAFIEIKEAVIRVRLLPLFAGRAELSKVTLDSPVIHLIKNTQGANNWQLFTNTPNKIQNTPTQPASHHFKLKISGISITNAGITYLNESAKTKIALEHFNLEVQDVALNQAFPVNAQFDLNTPDFAGPMKMTSELTLNPDAQTYQLHHFQLSADVNDPINSKRKIDGHFNANIDIDRKQQTIAINKLKIDINNVNLEGQILAQQFRAAPTLTGHINVKPFNMRALVNSFGNPPPATKSPFVLTKTQGSFDFTANSKAVNISPIHFTIDNSILTGTAAVVSLDTQPQFKFALKVDKVNLDDYLLTGTTTKKKNQDAQTTLIPAKTPVTTTATKPINCNINGSLEIGQFQFHNLNFQNINTGFLCKQSRLSLNPITADFYQGKLNGSLNISNLGLATALYTLSTNLSNIQVQPLLQDVAGTNKLTGLFNMTLNASTQGEKSNDKLQNLNGKAQINFSKGVLSGFDLAYQLSVIDSIIHKNNKPSPNTNATTVISSLTGTFNIKNGIIENNDLNAISPQIDVKGQGQIDLVQQKWNYHLRATALAGADARLINLEQLLGGSIPFMAEGTFDSFTILPDMLKIGQKILTSQVQQLGEQVNKALKGRLGKNINKFLNAGEPTTPAPVEAAPAAVQ